MWSKKVLSIVILLVGLTSCSTEEIPSREKQEEAVSTVLNEWHKAATEADFNSYFDPMDKASYFIGTDASENWDKEAFMKFSKPHFDKGKAWDFKVMERHIYFNDDISIAWFDELLNTWMGICRGSGVLEFKNKRWKIKHYVLSVTIPNEDMDEVIKIKRMADSTLIEQTK